MMTGQKKKPSISSLEQTTSTYLKLKTKYSRDMLNHIISVSKKKEGMIAEAGPGLGHFAVECRNRGFSYIGFEASEQLRGELIRKDLEVIDAYVPPIPLKDKQCDIFYASMILEHLATYQEASYFISEIFRVLNDRGYVCLVVPNYLTSKEFFFEMDYTHSFVTTKRRVTNLLRDADIKVIDVQHVIGWFWVKSGFFHHILRHLVNTIMIPVHFGITTWLFEYIGQENFLWKIRKTLFESLIIIGKKIK